MDGVRGRRGRWLAGLVVAAALAALLAVLPGPAGRAPAEARTRPVDPVVHTDRGAVRGASVGKVREFLDIPYAAPPVGRLRWAAPRAPRPWSGVRDAREPGPACPQDLTGSPEWMRTAEDCLHLGVTAPATASRSGKPKPVLVWMHGGGFVAGSGVEFSTRRLAASADVVVVSINYRLGILGSFPHPGLGRAGSFALQDQRAALEWVRRNARAFGGDPRNVTLGGVSAGAMSTCSLMTSPGAERLFDKAIVASGSCAMKHPAKAFSPESGPVSTWQPAASLAPAIADVGEKLGCPGTDRAAVRCLRGLSPDRLLKENGPLFTFVPYGTDALPTEPAAAIRRGEFARVPVLQGNTRDEWIQTIVGGYAGHRIDAATYARLLADSFGEKVGREAVRRYPLDSFRTPLNALSRIYTDNDWICPSLTSNRRYAEHRPTYTFVVDAPGAPSLDGGELPPEVGPVTPHGGDQPYLFDATGERPWPWGPTPAQRAFGEQVSAYWGNFARTGDPNGPGLPRWRPTTAGSGTEAQRLAPGPGGARPLDLAGVHHCDLWSEPEPGPNR